MKILITGADGFVGPYLMEELKAHGHELTGLTLKDFDICDQAALTRCLQNQKPDCVVHLAALSGYEQCRRDPALTWNVNTIAVETLAHCMAKEIPGARLLFISSAKIYKPSNSALSEEAELQAADFYGLSKMAADIRLGQLETELDLKIIRARAFNHTGSGQSIGFLCPDLISRLKKQEGQKGEYELQLGSLSAPVDLSDVRDIVRAYRLLIEKAPSGVYNVGQAQAITVGDVVKELEKVIGHSIKAIEKNEWKRSYSETMRLSDISKIKKSCQWLPEISLHDTLAKMWQEFEY